MSGSTEDLLKHTHYQSDEALEKSHAKSASLDRKTAQDESGKGIVNQGFVGEYKHQNEGDIYGLVETQRPTTNKRATSFQQKPVTSQSRRHSSPDSYGAFDKNGKTNKKVGLSKHRLKSASEEDLRRKAFQNSMKADRRFQSVSHLPSSVQDSEAVTSDEKQRNSHNKGDVKKSSRDLEERVVNTNAEQHNTKRYDVASKGVEQPSSSPRHRPQHEENTHSLQANVIALERAQLNQYKRRLTLALSERAKLTEQLQLLSTSLARQGLENTSGTSSPRSTLSVDSRRENLNTAYSPRHGLHMITLYSPREGLITDKAEKVRCLPPTPTKAKTELQTDQDTSRLSDPTYLSRMFADINPSNNSGHNLTRKKRSGSKATVNLKEVDAKTMNSSRTSQPTNLSRINVEKETDNAGDYFTPREKENLTEASEEIWRKHLNNGKELIDSDNGNTINDKPVRGKNNNSKKPLTVEEFLASDQENQQDFDENDKEIRRVLENARRHSPEIYEPLVRYNIEERRTETESSQDENLHDPPKNPLKQKKEDTDGGKKYKTEDSELFDTKNKEGRTESEKTRCLDQPSSPHYTRLQQNKQLHNYMTPPGTTGYSQENIQANVADRGDSTEVKSTDRPPSKISEKLQYYRKSADNRNEANHSSYGLADAYASEKDPEERMKIQQQAAGEAAKLRREASALLYEAMNLERLCDPNARVRHIYLPH